MITNIHIINGPNLNLLGLREPEIYGSMSFDVYFESIRRNYTDLNLSCLQTNHEGVIIDQLHQFGFEKNTGIILNAGGYSHTSIAIRDAIASIQTPVVEIHISDIYRRETFRWHSYLASVCIAHFSGHGLDGYRKAIEFLLEQPD